MGGMVLDYFEVSEAKLQSRLKYLKQTLVFMWNGTLPGKFNFYFLDFFASMSKEEDWALGYNFMKFWVSPTRQIVKQLEKIMFITNNHALFYLWKFFL